EEHANLERAQRAQRVGSLKNRSALISMSRWTKAREIAECCVCGRWSHGDWLVSGERNPRTRETPCDNFVCDGCRTEARVLREIDESLSRSKVCRSTNKQLQRQR